MVALKYRPKYWHTDDKRNSWTNWDEVVRTNGISNAREQAERLGRLRRNHKDSFHANARDAFMLCDELLVMLNDKKIELPLNISKARKLKTLIKRYKESSKEFFAVEDEIEMEQDLDEDDNRMIMDNWKCKLDSCDEPRITDKELHDIIKKTFKQKIETLEDSGK